MSNASLSYTDCVVITGGAEPDAAVDGDGSTQRSAHVSASSCRHTSRSTAAAPPSAADARASVSQSRCSLSDVIRPSGPSQDDLQRPLLPVCLHTSPCRSLHTGELVVTFAVLLPFFSADGVPHRRLHLARPVIASRPRRRLARAALRPRPPRRRGARDWLRRGAGPPRAAAAPRDALSRRRRSRAAAVARRLRRRCRRVAARPPHQASLQKEARTRRESRRAAKPRAAASSSRARGEQASPAGGGRRRARQAYLDAVGAWMDAATG